MDIYFDRRSGGFYSTASHGPRTITIDDPTFERPKILVPDPAYIAFDDSQEESVPMIEIDDLEVQVPQVIVDNPECLLPPASDLIEISVEHYQSLLEAQSTGMRIDLDDSGRPAAMAPLGPSIETLRENDRCWRDYQLKQTDGMVSRHRDELEAGQATTLSVEHYLVLQAYRGALRDWPEHSAFPDISARPPAPTWLVLP
ncbi:phage tail protein [Pseudomonas veronii]|uniref:phage tail assembly chaperone n=1 Tax=Pseudomonas veronii TaxID=76761 RepID=UPI0015A4CD65|nr:phage tail assembly chaperone [Pseudomonas veronii]NWD54283.1 phage tail protein [Pseudomonas veronii]